MNQKTNECNLHISDAFKALERFDQVLDSKLNLPIQNISTLQTDSRKINESDIFIAYNGITIDGHSHIKSLKNKNVGLIIFDDKKYLSDVKNSNWVLVKDSRTAWSILAAEAFDNPQDKMDFIGITGTNGKTSTIWILKEILKSNNKSFCSIGTLGIWINDEFIPSKHTTPDPDVLYNLLAKAHKSGVNTVVMEVSSHSLSQGKIHPIKFNGVGFTSFSQDHLDFHKDMDDYFQAKWKFFINHLLPKCYCYLNTSIKLEKNHFELLNNYNSFFYGIDDLKNSPYKKFPVIHIKNKNDDSTFLEVNDDKDKNLYLGEFPYFGEFNNENFTLALLIAEKVLKLNVNQKNWKNYKQIPGRLENIPYKNLRVFVDYAHTPDALEKVLSTLKSKTNLWVVFGCGGDRDKSKRPLMGAIAEKYSNNIVITSDNPRNEDPIKIIADIKKGIKDSQLPVIEIDREKAIAYAIKNSKENDTIVIAGKGHENYQIIKDKSFDFDDVLVANKYLLLRA